LDEKTRGFLEKAIDDIMTEEYIPSISWVQDEMPIKSLGEVAIGYVIGGIEAAATLITQMSKRNRSEKEVKEDEEEIRALLKRRLPEIVEKVNTELGK
jgi:signal recognition particle GTPase